jgi:hypothetical protein
MIHRLPIYIRSDFQQALKLRALIENKSLYFLCEELLAPHIEIGVGRRTPRTNLRKQIETNGRK